MLLLSTLNVGESARVCGFQATDKAYRHKLLSMGLTSGTEIYLERKAPLGDPLQIRVRGYALSLRKEEAAMIQVEKF